VPVTPLEPHRAVEPTEAGDVVVLTVRGRLDGDTGAALVRAASTAVGDEAVRVDIDLCSITGFTTEGARWLVRCRRLSGQLPEGLHYRSGRGPGQEALLAAYAEER
jgi:hypothetical protein